MRCDRLRFCGSLIVLSLLGLFIAAKQANAQIYPARTIRVIVGTSVSTPPDIISRIVATALSENEGWSVIVENKFGAMHSLAAQRVLEQQADGYTIMAVGVPTSAAPSLIKNIGFNLDTDFTPVVQLSASGNVLVVNPSIPAQTVPELVAHLKKNTDKLTFSSGGFGTPAHLIGELFKLQTGVKVTHVPYNELPRAITDLLQGINAYQFITVLPVVGLVQSGKLRALAVTSAKRVPVLPDVPTVAEAGYPQLTSYDWVGFSVKKGTPPEIVTKLNTAVNKALKNPKVMAAFEKIGSQPVGGTPAEFRDLVTSQVALWGKVVKDAGIKISQ